MTLTEEPNQPGGRKKTRTCDLDNNDHFWKGHKGSPFPLVCITVIGKKKKSNQSNPIILILQVAEKIQEELEDYRSKEDDIKKMKHDMGMDGESDLALGMLSDNTQRLTSAVSSLPALLEKKKHIDMHTSLATAILEQIKLRKLDVFFELEEKIMSKQQHLDKALNDLFDDSEAGTPEDKMRLLLIYVLCSQQVTDDEVQRFSHALEVFV